MNLIALNQTSANAGLGLQTLSGFNGSADVLSLTGFFSSTQLADIAGGNLAGYVQMSGSNLQVDMDGSGSAYAWTTIASLSGPSNFSTLSALLASRNLIIG